MMFFVRDILDGEYGLEMGPEMEKPNQYESDTFSGSEPPRTIVTWTWENLTGDIQVLAK